MEHFAAESNRRHSKLRNKFDGENSGEQLTSKQPNLNQIE